MWVNEWERVGCRAHAQNKKYVPLLSLHKLGSWAVVFPVTEIGSTAAYTSVIQANRVEAGEQRMFSTVGFESEGNTIYKSLVLGRTAQWS